uniref:Uncharacterized protein n=1 Tax=Sus scrofa TaxID=9823 RepID=A0A4X1UCD9_PIG
MHRMLSNCNCHPQKLGGEGQELDMGCLRQPQLPSHRIPLASIQPEAIIWQKLLTFFSGKTKKETETKSLGCPLPVVAPFNHLQVRGFSSNLSLAHSSYANKGAAPAPRRHSYLTLAQTPSAQTQMSPSLYSYSPLPMANSKGCKDGLRAQQECQNQTDHLQHQLTVAQEVLQRTKAQYTVCNQTVENLRDSLEMEKTQSQKQLKELQGEIKRLNQKLQEASEEAERLRKAFRRTTVNSGSFSCSSSSSLLFIAVVVLGLNALLT